MIIITGLGRCGTSFFLNLFKESGFGVGNGLSFSDELRAGMEFAPAYSISRDMFTDHICQRDPVTDAEIYTGTIPIDLKIDSSYWEEEISFRDKILRLDNDTPPQKNDGFIEVIKDPRITWNPKIIRAWWEVRKDIKLIILHRKPEDVIRSREEAGVRVDNNPNSFQDPKRRKDLRQFKEDFSDFMTEILKLEIPYTLFFYPNFMHYDSSLIYSRLFNTLDIDMTKYGKVFNEVWNSLLNKDMISNFEEGN